MVRVALAPELEVLVVLSDDELAMVDAHLREVQGHIRANPELRHKGGYDPNAWTEVSNRRESFRAELGTANYLGQPWRPHVGAVTPKPPDVGDDVEVKWNSRPNGDLRVDPEELYDERRYVNARGPYPTMYLAGWLYGSEVRRHPTRRLVEGRNLVHLAPAASCRPIGTLRR